MNPWMHSSHYCSVSKSWSIAYSATRLTTASVAAKNGSLVLPEASSSPYEATAASLPDKANHLRLKTHE